MRVYVYVYSIYTRSGAYAQPKLIDKLFRISYTMQIVQQYTAWFTQLTDIQQGFVVGFGLALLLVLSIWLISQLID